MTDVVLVCPACGDGAVSLVDTALWRCDRCSREYPGARGYVDLSANAQPQTADHYSLQWGGDLGFLKFIQDQPAAKAVMPSARLGWNRLFDEIRARTRKERTSVYDAGCGFGGVTQELVLEDTCGNLDYVGADVHSALPEILERIPAANACALFLRWDIGEPLPVARTFDYVLCRAAIHHTPNPRQTFRSLCASLGPSATIAISAYRRKGPCREAVDDAMRKVVGSMPPDQAFQASRQFTALGKALQAITQQVHIEADLPLLGIRAGTYQVQSLLYDHFVKCFHNPVFGDTYSTLVNYDWYHPPYAYRFEIDELREWFAEERLEIVDEQSIEVQHFIRGRRAA